MLTKTIASLILIFLPLFAFAEEENISAPSPDKGLLLTSLTYHGSYSGYSVLYRKIGSTDFDTLTIGTGTALIPPGMLDWDIKHRGLRGNIFAIDLPAGDYEVFSWRVSSGYGNTHPVNDFSIPFRIIPGKTTYIGNFKFDRKGGAGGTVLFVDVQQIDESSRDTEIFQKKQTHPATYELEMGIASNTHQHNLGGGSSATLRIPIPIPIRGK